MSKADVSLDVNWDVLEFYKGDASIAIFYSNLRFWIRKNEANGEMFENGKTWTYHSVKAFQRTFHFWSPKKIWGMTKKLEKDGFIVSSMYKDGEYHSKKYALGTRKIG